MFGISGIGMDRCAGLEEAVGPGEIVHRPVGFADLEIGFAPVRLRFSFGGVQPDGPVQVDDGAPIVALSQVRFAPVCVGYIVVRVEPDCPVEVQHRGIQVSLVEVRDASAVVCLSVPRGCRQNSLLQIITARSWQEARYDAVLLA